MKDFDGITFEERKELEELTMRVRAVDSYLDKRYKHLLAKFEYFREGDHDALDDIYDF